MTQYRLKYPVDPNKLRRHVERLLLSLDGKPYQEMTSTEATLINNMQLIEAYDGDGHIVGAARCESDDG